MFPSVEGSAYSGSADSGTFGNSGKGHRYETSVTIVQESPLRLQNWFSFLSLWVTLYKNTPFVVIQTPCYISLSAYI